MHTMLSNTAPRTASTSAPASSSLGNSSSSLSVERRPRSKVNTSQQHASLSERQEYSDLDVPFSPTHSSPIGYANTMTLELRRYGQSPRQLFHSLDELALNDVHDKAGEVGSPVHLHPASASSSNTGFSTIAPSSSTRSISPRENLPSIQTQFKLEKKLLSGSHTEDNKDMPSCTTPDNHHPWRPAASCNNTPATVQSSRFDSPSVSTALTTPSSYGLHQVLPLPTQYHSSSPTNVDVYQTLVPMSNRGLSGVEVDHHGDMSEFEAISSFSRTIIPISADSLRERLQAGRLNSNKHVGRPTASVKHSFGTALSSRTTSVPHESVRSATSFSSPDPDLDRDPTGTPAIIESNCFSEFAKSGRVAHGLVGAKNDDRTQWPSKEADSNDLSPADQGSRQLLPSSTSEQDESPVYAEADLRAKREPDSRWPSEQGTTLPHHRHIITPVLLSPSSLAHEDQEGEKGAALAVQHSAGSLLVIVVVSSLADSSTLASSVEGPEIVCIHLSDKVVHQSLAGVAILDLHPFLVGEMSKRTYSTMVMDAEDGLAKGAYWRADVVLVDGGDEAYGGSAGHDAGSSKSLSPLRSAASIAFASTLQNLRSTDRAVPEPLFALEGGITSLQVALRDARPATSRPEGGLAPSSVPSSPNGPSSPWLSMPLAQSPSRFVKEQQANLSSSPSTLPSSSPALRTIASPAPPPSTTTACRASRPLLARLDTSENVKKPEVSRDATKTARKESTSSPRLALNTRVGPRSATITEGAAEASPPLASIHREARRGSEPGLVEDSVTSAVARSIAASPRTSSRSFSLFSGAAVSASFEVSEIIEGSLYLGPDITTASEVDYLKETFGIKRILNAAYEIEAGGGKHLNLHEEGMSGIESYKKIPLKDTIEAQGVQRDIDEACAFIDDAREKSAPIYVHCKAGKSRSVMIVMAYLIHANSWTLRKSYGYVVDRRRSVSPNIGFVAELMAFEMRRLKTDSSDAPDISHDE